MPITLQAPAMGVVGWFATEHGGVVGPVEPSGAELDSLPDGRVRLVLRFAIHYPEGPNTRLRDATIHIGDIVRRHPEDAGGASLMAGDTVELTYTLVGEFD